MRLTDKQWWKVHSLLPLPARRADRRGRPWRDDREVLEGILWVLERGAPKEYPPYQTCHRRFHQWMRCGVLEQVLQELANEMWKEKNLQMAECFADAAAMVAEKREKEAKR